MSDIRRVIVETPFSGDIERNVKYARAAMRDCFVTYNEIPFASHLLYTQMGILNDNDVRERQLGIDAGLVWGSLAQATVVYRDLGITKGMNYGIETAQKCGRPVEFRELGPLWETFHEQLVFESRNHPFALHNVRM